MCFCRYIGCLNGFPGSAFLGPSCLPWLTPSICVVGCPFVQGLQADTSFQNTEALRCIEPCSFLNSPHSKQVELGFGPSTRVHKLFSFMVAAYGPTVTLPKPPPACDPHLALFKQEGGIFHRLDFAQSCCRLLREYTKGFSQAGTSKDFAKPIELLLNCGID